MVKNKNNETNRTEQTTPMMTMRIGNTTYEVNFHFSKTSKENMNQKVLKMMKSELLTANC